MEPSVATTLMIVYHLGSQNTREERNSVLSEENVVLPFSEGEENQNESVRVDQQFEMHGCSIYQ